MARDWESIVDVSEDKVSSIRPDAGAIAVGETSTAGIQNWEATAAGAETSPLTVTEVCTGVRGGAARSGLSRTEVMDVERATAGANAVAAGKTFSIGIEAAGSESMDVEREAA